MINNIFYFTLKDLKTDINKKSNNSIFNPIHGNYYVKSFLGKKKLVSENKIIINDDEQLNDIKLDIIIDNKNIDIDEKIPMEKTKDSNTEKSDKDKNNNEHSVFSINKIYFETNNKKKKGRKSLTSLVIGVHTKYSYDNILRKIKVKFLKKLINYINRVILSKYHSKIKILKPLEAKISQNNGINFNVKLLNLKIKDLFCLFGSSKKFKNIEKDYNKTIIQKIYEEKATEIIDILEMTFLEVFSIFRASNEENKLIGLEKLDKVIEEIKDKEKDDEYIKMFQNVAMNFENYYFKR